MILFQRAGVDFDKSESGMIHYFSWGDDPTVGDNPGADIPCHLFGIKPFYIEKGIPKSIEVVVY